MQERPGDREGESERKRGRVSGKERAAPLKWCIRIDDCATRFLLSALSFWTTFFYFQFYFYHCCCCCCRFGRFTYMHQSWLLWNLLHTFWRVRLHIYYACCAFPHPKRRQQLLLLPRRLLLLFGNRWTIQTTIKCHWILNNRKTCSSWTYP